MASGVWLAAVAAGIVAAMFVILVTFERLALRSLGCYGNTIAATPNFDRLASRGVVFDRHYAAVAGGLMDASCWLTGQIPVPPGDHPIPLSLIRNGLPATVLVEAGAQFPRCGFQQLRHTGGRDGLYASPEETPFAQLIEAGLQEIRALQKSGSGLLWLASRGVPSPWLPPQDWALRFLDFDEDDGAASLAGDVVFDADDLELEPPAEDTLDLDAEQLEILLTELAAKGVPGESLSADSVAAALPEHEQWKLSRLIYSGYVGLLDQQLGKLLDAIDEFLGEEDVCLIVTAAQGQLLGERTALHGNFAALAAANVHTPLVAWRNQPGKECTGGWRCREIVQTVDLAPTLCEMLDCATISDNGDGQSWLWAVDGKATPASSRSKILIVRDQLRAGILSASAYFVRGAAGTEHGPEVSPAKPVMPESPVGEGVSEFEFLFQKPDDVWDVNDVRRAALEDQLAPLRAELAARQKVGRGS